MSHYELLHKEASVRTWHWRCAQYCLRSIVRLEKSGCCRYDVRSHKRLMVIVSSGLVLGKDTASIANAFIKAILG